MEANAKQRLERIFREFEELHSLLSSGLSSAWEGEAFAAHLESEKNLYNEALKILSLYGCREQKGPAVQLDDITADG